MLTVLNLTLWPKGGMDQMDRILKDVKQEIVQIIPSSS